MPAADCFASPGWLLGLPPTLAAAVYLSYTHAGPALGRRWIWRAALRALACLALLAALAGPRLPGAARGVQAIAVMDLSDSVYDRPAQEAALRELAGVLESSGADAELGVVVFGRRPFLERGLAPLPERAATTRGPRQAPAPGAEPSVPPLPNVRQPASELDGTASDIGAALDFARGRFPPGGGGARALVLIGDGLDTAGRAHAAAAALRGSGVDLLAWPLELGAGSDAYVAALKLPERARAGQGLAVEVSVAAQRPMEAQVRVVRREGGRTIPVGIRVVHFQAPPAGSGGGACRATLSFVDRPDRQGVIEYAARIEGPGGKPLSDNFNQNDALRGAVRVEGPERWAVLARTDSTLARWAADTSRPLGVDVTLFTPGKFPREAEGYRDFAGALIGGLSVQDLPLDSDVLQALAAAQRGGLGLVAVGGADAFGAGGHPEGGAFEALLPVTLRPEDDRARAVLIAVDTSSSMGREFSRGVKLEFARHELEATVQHHLRSTDRVGLIGFGGEASLVAPLAGAEARGAFAAGSGRLHVGRWGQTTDLRAALKLAGEVLAQDDAEERLLFLVSDGVDTAGARDEDLEEAVRRACPPPAPGAKRRATLHAFGIGVGDASEPGERAMRRMAQAGGGEFHPDFLKLGELLKQVLDEQREDFYVRREPFGVREAFAHPVLAAAGGPWPVLPFRNRVMARPESETLLESAKLSSAAGPAAARRPDPLLVLGHRGPARAAALALELDGAYGQALLASQDGFLGGRPLLAALLSWAAGHERDERREWSVETEDLSGELLRVCLRARAPESFAPINGLELAARLGPLSGPAPARSFPLFPDAPGRYTGAAPAPQEGILPDGEFSRVYRLEVLERGASALERFVTVSYPAEYRRFGTDRAALAEWVRLAEGSSRTINLPARDVAAWLAAREGQQTRREAWPICLILAGVFFLAEVALRGLRLRSAR